MGAFPVMNPGMLNTRKKALAQKLMGRALGGRAIGGGGNLFRQPGATARGGGASRIVRGNSTNPWAVGELGGAFGHGYDQEFGGNAGSEGHAVGEGALFGTPGAPDQSAVNPGGILDIGPVGGPTGSPTPPPGDTGGSGTFPTPADENVSLGPYNPGGYTGGGDSVGGAPWQPHPSLDASPGQNLIPMGDGTFFDLGTGQIVGGSGDYSGYGSGGSSHGSYQY